jgi:glycosyltransferase involved in cell wall biosynthesis
MSDALRDAAPDIVHAHWTYEFELAAQDSTIPHVTTAHDAPITILRQLRDPYRAVRLAVAVRTRPGIRHLSTVSPYLAKRWRKEMVFRRPIEVIPNSIPTNIRPRWRRPARHPVILEVADAGKLKNVRGLLHAFASVRGAVPEAELRLVGPRLGKTEAMALWAESEGLASGVSFLGPLGRPEVAEEYGRAWLFVHASLEESFGLAILEAMASGLPVVAGRDSGGVSDVMDYGHAGWLTDVRDPRALAGAIVGLIGDGPPDPPKSAESFVVGNFSPSVVTKQYVDWYSRTIQAGGHA